MRYTIIWDPKQLSPDAINMMQNIVDSHLNLQLDNYYLINKGRSRMGVIPRYNEMTPGVFISRWKMTVTHHATRSHR